MWNKFVETTAHHFHFLETEFGFVQTSVKPPFVIYESNELQILVFFDVSRGHELDLRIRKINDDPRKTMSIGIGMLMGLKKRQNSEGYPIRFPSTEQALEVDLKSLAEHLRKYGSNLLQGNLHDFERLEQIEKELAKGNSTRQP